MCPEPKRERFLSKEELARLGEVLETCEREKTESRYAVTAFQLLILTGCRLAEIQTLKWRYLGHGCLNSPDSKTGARRIPLPPEAESILDSLPRVGGNEYVVAGMRTRDSPAALQIRRHA